MSLFAKFRISSAKDSGQTLPPSLQKQVEASEQLQSFAKEIETVDAVLHKTRPVQANAPADLHSSIMVAVREHRHRRSREKRTPRLAWWLPAPALAALLVWALVHFWSGPTETPNEVASLASAVSSVEKGVEMARRAPEGAVAPLSQELNRLRGDVQKAKEFLMASLP